MELRTKSHSEDYKFVEKTGKINSKSLFQYLYPIPPDKRHKTVINPSARATLPCKPDFNPEVVFKQFINGLNQLHAINYKLYAIALIQFTCGARITQVLSISPSCISSTGILKLPALKYSNPIIVNIPELHTFLLAARRGNFHPFAEFNRFYIYRMYLKTGLFLHNVNKNQMAVTHSFRYLLGTDIYNNFDKLTDTKDFLKHKSINSTKHYVKSRL